MERIISGGETMPETLHVHRRWVDSTMEEAKTNINRIINRWYYLVWMEKFHNCPRCKRPLLHVMDLNTFCCTNCNYVYEVIPWKQNRKPNKL